MRIRVKVNAGGYIRDIVMKNLLIAHKRIADAGDILMLIKLSRFILKLSKNYNDELIDFWSEKCSDGAENPSVDEKGV